MLGSADALSVGPRACPASPIASPHPDPARRRTSSLSLALRQSCRPVLRQPSRPHGVCAPTMQLASAVGRMGGTRGAETFARTPTGQGDGWPDEARAGTPWFFSPGGRCRWRVGGSGSRTAAVCLRAGAAEQVRSRAAAAVTVRRCGGAAARRRAARQGCGEGTPPWRQAACGRQPDAISWRRHRHRPRARAPCPQHRTPRRPRTYRQGGPIHGEWAHPSPGVVQWARVE